MKLASAGLLSASIAAGSSSTFIGPTVPWWGELIMAIVSAALAFFAGRREAQ